ncbi:MAG TPA: hypothetical protein VN616_16825, partial [Puia sp.]|nr:hypothetical protein [Puia sp.]
MKKTAIHKDEVIMIQESENQPANGRVIHSYTSIHPNARIGDDVQVDPFTMIHKNVEIGSGSWIGSNVTIMEGAR